MANFALDVNSPPGDVISSLNYALANLGTIDANVVANIATTVVETILANSAIVSNVLANANVVTANTTTGALSSSHTGTINYLYNYVNVKYSTSPTGSTGFSSNSSGATYYGVRNTQDGSISNNPADYNWKQVVGGFGTTKGLYHTTAGGGIVYFEPATVSPSIYYIPVIDNTPIALQTIANSLVKTTTINPGAVTNVGIATQTITTNNMAFGVITAELLAANLIIAKDIVSTNATLGNLTSNGYWLQANSGSARFGGNVSIGNNLTIGNNAVIGGNLVVSGLITSGSLNANIVSTTVIQQNAVTTTGAVKDFTGGLVSNPAMSFQGYSAPYYQYQSGIIAPILANVTATTANVTNVISGAVDVLGWSSGANDYIPQMYVALIRYINGGVGVVVSGSTITSPAYFLYPGGTTGATTQTLAPVRLPVVGIVDNFTIATVPSVISYAWVIGSLLQFSSNVSPNPSQANISYTTLTTTVTNYKR